MTRTLTITAIAIASLTFGASARAQGRWTTLDEFLTGAIRLNPQELAALGRGDVVAKMLPSGDSRDIAVFGAVRIDVPRSFFIDQQRDVPRALRTPSRTQVAMFSDPATAADVQQFDLSTDDLKELRSCRPSDCNFKLPATDMERARTTIASGADAKTRVADYARTRMVEYVTDYRSRGNDAMVVYDDRGTVRSGDSFAAMLRDSSFVFLAVPSLGRALMEYPRARPAGAADVIFWSRDELPHLRRVQRITHQTIFAPPERQDLTLIAAKQIYADHYFEAGLEVLAAVDRGAEGITLVAIRRFRFDHMPSGGLLNIRGRVSNGLRENIVADLKRLERDTESAWAARR